MSFIIRKFWELISRISLSNDSLTDKIALKNETMGKIGHGMVQYLQMIVCQSGILTNTAKA